MDVKLPRDKLFLFKKLINKCNHFLIREYVGRKKRQIIFSFDHIGLTINTFGQYEKTELFLLEKVIEKLFGSARDYVCVDVGANIGNHASFFSERFRKVIAFEINPEVFKVLALNCEGSNVICHNIGLSNVESEFCFEVNDANLGGSKIIHSCDQVYGHHYTKLQVTRLDNVTTLVDEQPVKFIKLDVEGHELEVLEGGIELIRNAQPVIAFELQASQISRGTSPILEFLSKEGYKFFTFEGHIWSENFAIDRVVQGLQSNFIGKKYKLKEVQKLQTRFYSLIYAVHKNDSAPLYD